MDVCLYASALERLIAIKGVAAVAPLIEKHLAERNALGLRRLRIAMEIILVRQDEIRRFDDAIWNTADQRVRNGYGKPWTDRTGPR